MATKTICSPCRNLPRNTLQVVQRKNLHTIRQNSNRKVHFWTSDIIFVWKLRKNTTPDGVKSYLNSIEPGRQFPLEMEKDRILTSLIWQSQGRTKDLLWKRTEKRHIIFQACDLCALPKDRDNELDFLSEVFISNGYPVEVVDKVISGYISQKHRTANKEIKPKEQIDFANMLKIPSSKVSLIS